MKGFNVRVTDSSFINPFSFFCSFADPSRDDNTSYENQIIVHSGHIVPRTSISDVNHGQYVAVLWHNKWTRGIISMESQFLIWLVDFGMFIQPDSKTVYIDLSPEFRNLPTKVFEAAVHGVVPMEKCISANNEEFEIQNKMCTSWNKGAVEKCKELLKCAVMKYFVPIALMSTKDNDIVLGDLYLEMPGKKLVNIIDELEKWPVFLEKNKEAYIENLSKYYVTRRKHRACQLKPEFAHGSLPVVSPEMTLEQYSSLAENPASPLPTPDSDEETEVADNKTKDVYNLTPAEIQKYAKLFVTIHGEEYNVLNVLINKARVMRMCERYKDHDLRSIGRGISCRRSFRDDDL